MAIDFPNSPTNGQTHTVGATTWTYDGSKWNKNATTIIGPTGPNPLVIQTGTPSTTNVLWLDSDAEPTTSSVPLSTIDNKGELLVGTAADTVGVVTRSTTNGDMLVVDTSTTSGLRWQSQTSTGRNFVINGGFDIWQRGTSFTGTSPYYTADRWQGYREGAVSGATFSRQTSSVDNFTYAFRAQRNSGNTSTNGLNLATSFETTDIKHLHNKVLTISFYARCGANYSSTSSLLNVSVISGTGTDGNLAVGLTGNASEISANVTLTTTFQRFSITSAAPLAATKTQLGILFYAWQSGTAGANDWFEITGIQLEVGSVATEFDFEPYETTLRKCQRYFQTWKYDQANEVVGVLGYTPGNYYYGATSLDTTMRTTPATTLTSATFRKASDASVATATLVYFLATSNGVYWCFAASNGGLHATDFFINMSNASAEL